ncbi:HMA2 domain-containing protein [Desulfocicer niacini]
MYIVHNVPGRIRIKLEKMKNDSTRLNHVKKWLMVDGVKQIKSNALTGSVVVEFDPSRVSSDKFLEILNKNNCHVSTRSKSLAKMEKSHEKIAVKVGKATFSWLAGQVLEANGLSYIAAFI